MFIEMDVAIYYMTDYKYNSFSQRTNFGCRVSEYLTKIARDCSSYIVLAFTIDRFVSVKFPLKKSLWITKRRVEVTLLVFVIIFATAESYVPYYLKRTNYLVCTVMELDKCNRLVAILRYGIEPLLPVAATAILNVDSLSTSCTSGGSLYHFA